MNRLPDDCLWCGAPGEDQPQATDKIIHEVRQYACGTRISRYDALLQVSKACSDPPEHFWYDFYNKKRA